jgi:8-amino-7-oxononanoate synthase
MKINRQHIENWLVHRVAEILMINESEISLTEPFASFGLGSVDSVGITGELEDFLNLNLSPDLLWNYPNIRSLAEFLDNEIKKSS